MTLISSRTVGRRCLVCGAAHATCGPKATVRPVDEISEGIAVNEPLVRAWRVLNGKRALFKVPLSEAQRLGLEIEERRAEPELKKQPAVPNKARRTSRNKGSATK